jgi:hypothetical protein
MEYYALQKIKEEWGKKPCDHQSMEKIYYTGAFLTTYACKQCGAEFTIAQKMEMDEERKLVTNSKLSQDKLIIDEHKKKY